jgi:hypothetical protein
VIGRVGWRYVNMGVVPNISILFIGIYRLILPPFVRKPRLYIEALPSSVQCLRNTRLCPQAQSNYYFS